MTLHEFMHGFIAYKLGDDTPKLLGRLTINPLKHIDPMLTIAVPMIIIITSALSGVNTPIFGGAKPVPFNPGNVKYGEWGVALLAIAGPLTNLLIAFVCFGVLAVLQVPLDTTAGGILSLAIMINLGFFAFNILPIPPLDGSRVIYSLAPDFVRRGMEMMESFGLIIVFLIVFLGGGLVSTYMNAIITGTTRVFSIIFGVG
ncbi:MAG: site-2 protease family protein [Candidatus Saccharimonas sp.]